MSKSTTLGNNVFKNMFLKIAILNTDKYGDEKDFINNYKLGFSEMDDIYSYIFLKLNISTWHIKRRYDNLLDLMKNGKADVLFRKMVPLEWFSEYGTITLPLSVTETRILSAYSKEEKQFVFTPILAFTWVVWVFLIVSILAMVVLIALLEINTSKRSFASILRLQMWNAFSVLLWKPRVNVPLRLISKFILMLMFLEVFIILGFFNGNYKSISLVIKYHSFNSFEDVLDTNSKIIIQDTFPARVPLNAMLRTARYKWLEPRIVEIDSEEYLDGCITGDLIRDISGKRNAIVDTTNNLFACLEFYENINSLHFSKFKYFPVPVVFIINRDIPGYLLEMINFRILKFVETKQSEPYRRLTQWRLRNVKDIGSQDYQALALKHVNAILHFYFFGVVLSTFVTIIEMILSFSYHKTEKKLLPSKSPQRLIKNVFHL